MAHKPASAHKVVPLASIPSVDRVLNMQKFQELIAAYGRPLVTTAVRNVLEEVRSEIAAGMADTAVFASESRLSQKCAAFLKNMSTSSMRTVFNLTGTVLHTNLGRALLPAQAVESVARAMTQACNLEYDLESSDRGDRDDHVEKLICSLTGAEAATVVNNNAAAVLLVLNTLAARKEVIVSRGELIEIGGSFRLPDIMKRSGCKLVEVGTTNRTHLCDYESAIGIRTGLILKVHTSNYAVQGFTANVPEIELSRLARSKDLPLAVDLGSGALVDLTQYGLPREPTPQEAIIQGADIVTFSGDKLLGGPQAGIIVGRRPLIAKIKKNPLKRALRVNKMTLAALQAVLHLYRSPDTLKERLPTLALLTRSPEDIHALAEKLKPHLVRALHTIAIVDIAACHSQIGSGALPVDTLPSFSFTIKPLAKKSGLNAELQRINKALKKLPVPVIGRVASNAIHLDLRCLTEDCEAEFTGQLVQLPQLLVP
jgi:L-seryl-tRNA(Ser) seleniumtransferase